MSAQLLALVESWIEAGAEPEATAWILLSMAVSSTALRDKIANNVIGERTLVDLVRTMYGQALARAAGEVTPEEKTAMIAGLAELHEDDEDPDPTIH